VALIAGDNTMVHLKKLKTTSLTLVKTVWMIGLLAGCVAQDPVAEAPMSGKVWTSDAWRQQFRGPCGGDAPVIENNNANNVCVSNWAANEYANYALTVWGCYSGATETFKNQLAAAYFRCLEYSTHNFEKCVFSKPCGGFDPRPREMGGWGCNAEFQAKYSEDSYCGLNDRSFAAVTPVSAAKYGSQYHDCFNSFVKDCDDDMYDIEQRVYCLDRNQGDANVMVENLGVVERDAGTCDDSSSPANENMECTGDQYKETKTCGFEASQNAWRWTKVTCHCADGLWQRGAACDRNDDGPCPAP